MAFTYDLTTDRGKARLKLSDTDSAAYVFEDEEIDYFLTDGGTVDGAVVVGARVLLASAARRTKHFAVQGLTLDDRHQVQALLDIIGQYGGNVATATVSGPVTHPFDQAFDISA